MRVHRRIAERCLRDAGIAGAGAARFVDQLEAELRRELGGCQTYIALDRPTTAHLAERAAALREKGLSAADVAARLGRSESSVFRLLQLHRASKNSD